MIKNTEGTDSISNMGKQTTDISQKNTEKKRVRKARAMSATQKDSFHNKPRDYQMQNQSDLKSSHIGEYGTITLTNVNTNRLVNFKRNSANSDGDENQFLFDQKKSSVQDSNFMTQKDLLIAEVSTHLKNKGHKSYLKDGTRTTKKQNHERYDQDGRTANRMLHRKNRKLKTIGKVEVSLSNSTYLEYNNYLKNREK